MLTSMRADGKVDLAEHRTDETFGWDKRNPEPRSMRDAGDLVG